MRAYGTNSPEAAARLVVLALISDGGFSSSELKSLSRIAAYERLGLSASAFMRVLRETCADLDTRGLCMRGHFEPTESVLRTCFADISDRDLQRRLAFLILEVLQSDEVMHAWEVMFLDAALEHWGLGIHELDDLSWHAASAPASARSFGWQMRE